MIINNFHLSWRHCWDVMRHDTSRGGTWQPLSLTTHVSRVTCHTYPYSNTATVIRFPSLPFWKILFWCVICSVETAERILIWYKFWSEHGVCPLLLSTAELQNQVHTTAVFWPLYSWWGNLMNTLLPASTTTWVDIIKHSERILTYYEWDILHFPRLH